MTRLLMNGRQLLLLLTLLLPAILVRAAEPLNEDDLLLFELSVDRYVLSDALTGYGSSEGVWLSLSELAAHLDLAIEVDASKTKAEGWFIDEGRRFRLEILDSGVEVAVGEERLYAPLSSVQIFANDILVDPISLGAWLPIDFDVDFSNLKVTAVPREPLPVQQRILRMSRDPRARPTAYRPQMPVYEVPYSLFAAPHADITLSNSVSRWESTGNSDTLTSYSLIARGDLAYMSSQIYLSGNNNNNLDQARLMLERGDPNGELLGPMSASRIQLGDLTAPAFPLLGTRPVERGVLIERSPLGRLYDFDSVDITGDVEPDWEVDLYWNNTLINRQVVGADGRYAFTAVPLNYGNNEFELVFYGPDGSERRETRSYYVGPGMQRAGRLDYQLVYTEKGRSVFGEGELPTLPTNPETPRLTGRLSLGLGGGFSIGAGMHSVEFNDVRHDYTHYELRSTLRGLALTLRSLEDSEGGESYEGVFQSSIGSVSLRGDYYQNEGMLLESELNSLDRRLSEGSLALSTRLGVVPVTLSYRDTQRELSSTLEVGNYFTVPMNRAFISNTLNWRRDETALGEADTLAGSLQLTTSGQPLQWRVRASYELDPRSEVTELFAAANLRIDNRMRMYFEATHIPGVVDFTRYRAGMNWRMEEALITPSIAYDSDGNYFGYINVSFGLGPSKDGSGVRMSSNRLSQYGNVAARFYADENANGRLDANEQPLSEVIARAKPGYRWAESDEEGYLMLDSLDAYQPVDLLVDRSSISDPGLLPIKPGVGLIPRPGRQMRLDFPLQRTGEIEGTLYLRQESGQEALAGVEVWLVNARGEEVQRTRTGYDGFFLFSELPAGRYRLRWPERYRSRDAAAGEWLVISHEGDVLTGNELLLSDTQVPQATVEPEALPVLNLGAGLVSPAPAPQLTAPAVQAPVRPAEPVAVGDSGVQLSAHRSQAAAEAMQQRLLRENADLLKGLKFEVHRADLGGRGVFYRLVVGTLPREEALQLCDRLKERGQGCFVVTLP